MPAHDANKLQFERDGYYLPAYMSIMTGTLVWQGIVSVTPIPVSAFSLAVTETSGDATNIRRGMRVVVESSTGKYKGTLSVRYAGLLSNTSIPVRELSIGEVGIIAGDVIKVFSDLLLTDKPPIAAATFRS